MKKKSLLLLLIIWNISNVHAQDTPKLINLEEAIEWGLENNRTLQNANLELKKAYKQKWITLAVGFPQINANLNYDNNLELPVSLIPAEVFGGNPGEFSEVAFGTKFVAKGSIELNQLLFDGSYLVGVLGIKHFIQNSKNILEKTELEVKKLITESYLNAITTDANLEVLENNITVISKNLEEARQLFDNGFEEEESIEQLQLTLASLENQLNYSKNMSELTHKALNLILGLELDAAVGLSDTLDTLVLENILTETPTEEIKNNIDLRLAEDQITSKKLLYDLERSKSLPSLSAFVNGGYTGNNNSFQFTGSDQKWFGFSAFGLRLKAPIFSSFGRTANVQKAKITLEQAKVSFKEAQDKIQLEYNQAKNNYTLAVKTFDNAKDQLDLAKRIEEKNRIKFFEGLSGSLELRQAQLQLYSSQQKYIQSMKDVISKKTALNIIINNPQ